MDAGPDIGDGGELVDGESGDAQVGTSNRCKRGIAYGRNTAVGLEALSKEARGLPLVSPAVGFCGPESECHDTDPIVYRARRALHLPAALRCELRALSSHE